jgi:hypothetical protein
MAVAPAKSTSLPTLKTSHRPTKITSNKAKTLLAAELALKTIPCQKKPIEQHNKP